MNIQEKWKRILMKIDLLLLLAVCTLAGCGKSVEQQIAEQLTLGQKYLEELDYEQAIVAFNQVIELDAKEMQAYTGLVTAYDSLERYEEVYANIERGLEIIAEQESITEKEKEFLLVSQAVCGEQDNQQLLQRILELLLTLEPENETYKSMLDNCNAALKNEKYVEEHKEQLERILLLCENGDVEAITDFMLSDEYQNIVESIGTERNICYPSLNGKGIRMDGYFPYDGYLYYGELQNGIREGYGIWYYVGINTNSGIEERYLNRFSGDWLNDYPNGKGIEEKFFNYEFQSKTSGTYHNGKEDGEMELYYIFNTGEGVIFNYAAKEGKTVVIGEASDGTEICAYGEERESWLSLPDENGIQPFSQGGATQFLSLTIIDGD